MNELALFAGVGGGILGGHLLGWRTVCAVEYNPHCAQVLAQRQNDGILRPFPIWDDIRTFDGRPWRGIVDVVSGGFPCQAFSSAASGRNNAEDLWPEMRRVVADVAPWCVSAENVSQHAIDCAADDLEQMGYSVRCVALSAEDVGADHIRSRYWLLAHADPNGQLLRAFNAKASELPLVPSGVWLREPERPRVPDGLADWMESIRATGNGQVPAVAALAFAALAASF